MKIQTVAVIGVGQMGDGMAQACAMTGHHPLLRNPKDTILPQASSGIAAPYAPRAAGKKGMSGTAEPGRLFKADPRPASLPPELIAAGRLSPMTKHGYFYPY